MSTQTYFKHTEITANNSAFNQMRVLIETPFYANNVIKVKSLKDAYELARNSPGAIETDMLVFRAEEIGLEPDAKVLVFNDGNVRGRAASARRIAGEPEVDKNDLNGKVNEAIYQSRNMQFYQADVYIGLHEDFMVKAHILIPKGDENIMYSWMLNFQYMSDEYNKMYERSQPINKETDIYIFTNSQWSHPDHPMGLSYFDPDHNCAAILGMRYLGEYKKGTLTLAWAIANRNGFASCHGGQKRYNLPGGKHFVAGVFGLSGSGKSTITHAHHGDKYDITVLHDDAFIISTLDGSSIALEPAYFDKTQDYPLSSPDNKYLVTVQNCGITLDENGRKVIVTEDIRNGNGRAIKSKLWSPNRVDKFEEPVNAIFWIMKDATIPPIIKLKSASLASIMGATLATKRSTAERLAPGADPDALVIEPYANPFRTYPLVDDYEKFKQLVNRANVDCYIINTGDFMGKKVKPSDTLGIIELIVEGKAEFKQWGSFKEIDIMEWEGFVPNMNDLEYKKQLKARMNDRIQFVKSRETVKGGFDKLPHEALEALEKIISELG